MPRGRWQASVCLFLYSTETFAMKPQNPKPYLLACAALALGSVQAADLQELAKASGCFSCHSMQEKVVGPAFSAVAQKYAGQADAAPELAQSIRNGSVRKWGRAPMPAHGSLEQADIQRLAEWVLTIKP
jgi:cytochrome c